MKLHRIPILCMLLGAAAVAHGQGSLTVSLAPSSAPCTPSVVSAGTSNSCFAAEAINWDGYSTATTPATAVAWLSKQLNNASTTLFMDMLRGKSIPELTIAYYAVKPGGTTFLAYSIEFENVYVTAESSSAETSGGPAGEYISIAFQKIVITYYPVNSDGAVGNPVIVTYDQTLHEVS
jgi:type VI protein secretion system component Hcp